MGPKNEHTGRGTAWSPLITEIVRPRWPEALQDPLPALNALIAAFGSNAAARLIDVSPATVTNWRNEKRRMDPQYSRRVVDLYYVLARAFQAFQPASAMDWLVGTNGFLDNARPIDVLALQGPARVIAAIDAFEAGDFP